MIDVRDVWQIAKMDDRMWMWLGLQIVDQRSNDQPGNDQRSMAGNSISQLRIANWQLARH